MGTISGIEPWGSMAIGDSGMVGWGFECLIPAHLQTAWTPLGRGGFVSRATGVFVSQGEIM